MKSKLLHTSSNIDLLQFKQHFKRLFNCRSFKILILLIAVILPSILNAQLRNDRYLHQLFLAQGGLKLFEQVDVLKKQKKEMVARTVKEISDASRNDLISKGEQALDRPWPLLTMADFYQFKATGDRAGYEANYFARRNKLNALIIAEVVEQKGRFLPQIVAGLGLVLEESTWAIPAHMYLQKAGEGLPDTDEPVIDLFVGQTATILAWTRLLLADQLNEYSPLLIKRIDKELRIRVFEPYLARDDFWWMGFIPKRMNNWNIYVNSNVLITALLAQDDKMLRDQIIEKSVRSVDNFLNSYSPDGGCDEGPSYWGIAGGALVDYLVQLSDFSGEKLDFSKSTLIHSMGAYIYRVHIDKNYYVNFADASAVAVQDIARIFNYGALFNDKNLLQFAAYIRKNNKIEDRYDSGSIHAFAGSLKLKGRFENIKPQAPLLRSFWFPDLQVLTARQREGTASGLFFGAKAGHNNESHNHNDVGSFVLYQDGTPLVVDPGVGVYTKQTFGPDRYKLWYMQSGWHNCPTINGTMQQAGKDFRALEVTHSQTRDKTSLSMDVAKAYPAGAQVSSWKREFVFDHKKGSLRLTEDFVLKSFKQPSETHIIVYGDVSDERAGRLKLTNPEGRSIYVLYDPNILGLSLETKEIDDKNLARSWKSSLTRITFRLKGNEIKQRFDLEFISG